MQFKAGGCPSGLYTDYKNILFADSVDSVIFHFYDTHYKQSTLYMKTPLPLHCLQFEHTASCTTQVQTAIRWSRSPNNEAIAPTTWTVKTLKMGSNPL
uniref:Uncharacterized protein n=1 Tax=Rhipicephalus zambeziensis TaxID=60191 RepID=A0A224Y6Z8_9ACAR